MAQKTLTVDAGQWSQAIAALLASAVDTVDEIAAQVQRGTAQLFAVSDGGEVIGAFVLRVDVFAFGTDGVIVAAAGRGGETNLTSAMLPTIEKMFRDCDRVRIHTARPGLAKILSARHGYRLQELVLAKDIRK